MSIAFVDGNGNPTAQIDLGGDLFVNADGPTRFIASSTEFQFTATGNSPLNGSVQVAINVLAGADCALGTATFSPVGGPSANVTVTQTRKSFPVTNGPFCIPIS